MTSDQIDFYLNQARSAGVPEAFIEEYLRFNRDDYHRILESYASEGSAQTSAQFQRVVTETALASQFTGGNIYGSPGTRTLDMAVPTGLPTAINFAGPVGGVRSMRSAAFAYAPLQGSVDIRPSPATSGPPGPLGYTSSSDQTGIRPPALFALQGVNGGGLDIMTIALIGIIGYLVWSNL